MTLVRPCTDPPLATTKAQYMYTQIKSTQKSHTPVFVIAGQHEPSTKFVVGKCVCKACGSKDLSYFAYVDDAKCNENECRQWQNEDPTID